jgi:hypothetical protein
MKSRALTLGLLLAATAARGQTLHIPAGSNESEIRANAEADGIAFQRAAASLALQPGLNRSEAIGGRNCVTGFETGPAHSGEFLIGGMLAGHHSMLSGREGKVWWQPSYGRLDMPPLLVRGRNLNNPSDTVRFESARLAWQVNPDRSPVPVEQRDYFFPSGITIPTPGRWLLIATSGVNWGCFILTVV